MHGSSLYKQAHQAVELTVCSCSLTLEKEEQGFDGCLLGARFPLKLDAYPKMRRLAQQAWPIFHLIQFAVSKRAKFGSAEL